MEWTPVITIVITILAVGATIAGLLLKFRQDQNTRFNQIEMRLASLTESIAELTLQTTKSIAELTLQTTKDIAALQLQTTKDMAELKDEMKGLIAKNIAELKDEMKDQAAKLDAMTNELHEMNGRLTKVENLRKVVDENQSRLKAMKDTLNQQARQ